MPDTVELQPQNPTLSSAPSPSSSSPISLSQAGSSSSMNQCHYRGVTCFCSMDQHHVNPSLTLPCTFILIGTVRCWRFLASPSIATTATSPAAVDHSFLWTSLFTTTRRTILTYYMISWKYMQTRSSYPSLSILRLHLTFSVTRPLSILLQWHFVGQ